MKKKYFGKGEVNLIKSRSFNKQGITTIMKAFEHFSKSCSNTNEVELRKTQQSNQLLKQELIRAKGSHSEDLDALKLEFAELDRKFIFEQASNEHLKEKIADFQTRKGEQEELLTQVQQEFALKE